MDEGNGGIMRLSPSSQSQFILFIPHAWPRYISSDMPLHSLSRSPQLILSLSFLLTYTHSAHSSSVCLMALHCDVRTHLHVQCVRPAPHTQLLTNPHGWFSSEAVDNPGKNRGARSICESSVLPLGHLLTSLKLLGFPVFLGFHEFVKREALWAWMGDPGTLQVMLLGDRHVGNGSFTGR